MDRVTFLQSLFQKFPGKNEPDKRFTAVEKSLQKYLGLGQAVLLFRQGNVFRSLPPKNSLELSDRSAAFRHLTSLQKPWIAKPNGMENHWTGYWPVLVDGQCVACYALGPRLKKGALTVDEKKVMELLSERTSLYLADKKLWGELERANRQITLGWMSAAVVHEMRNPLSALNTLIQLFPKKREDAVFLESFEKLAEKEVRRLIGITEELQGFLKNDSEIRTKIDSTRVIHHVVRLVRQLFNTKNVRLKVKTPPSFTLAANEDQLESLILNLLQNALDAVERGGSVEISSKFLAKSPFGSNWFELKVKDDGKGISKDEISTIFSPYFSTKKTNGSGLGLAICRRIVDNHKGYIRVKSFPKKGSTFLVYLPCSNRALN